MTQVEREERPRKVFELKFEIWDDGEVTNSIVEIVPQDRGAPKKWHLQPNDFKVSLKNTVSQNDPSHFGDIFLELLGLKRPSYSKPEADVVESESESDEDFDFDENAA